MQKILKLHHRQTFSHQSLFYYKEMVDNISSTADNCWSHISCCILRALFVGTASHVMNIGHITANRHTEKHSKWVLEKKLMLFAHTKVGTHNKVQGIAMGLLTGWSQKCPYFTNNTGTSDLIQILQVCYFDTQQEQRQASTFSLCLYARGTDLRFPLHARSFRNTCFPECSAAALWGQRHSDQTLW